MKSTHSSSATFTATQSGTFLQHLQLWKLLFGLTSVMLTKSSELLVVRLSESIKKITAPGIFRVLFFQLFTYLNIFVRSSKNHLIRDDTATKILPYLFVGLSIFSSASQFSVSQFSVVITEISPSEHTKRNDLISIRFLSY